MEKIGNCYQLAVEYLWGHQDCTVVHAMVYSFALRHMIAHAIIRKPNGEYYDPVSKLDITAQDMKDAFQMKILDEYAFAELSSLIMEHASYGPWVDHPEYHDPKVINLRKTKKGDKKNG